MKESFMDEVKENIDEVKIGTGPVLPDITVKDLIKNLKPKKRTVKDVLQKLNKQDITITELLEVLTQEMNYLGTQRKKSADFFVDEIAKKVDVRFAKGDQLYIACFGGSLLQFSMIEKKVIGAFGNLLSDHIFSISKTADSKS